MSQYESLISIIDPPIVEIILNLLLDFRFDRHIEVVFIERSDKLFHTGGLFKDFVFKILVLQSHLTGYLAHDVRENHHTDDHHEHAGQSLRVRNWLKVSKTDSRERSVHKVKSYDHGL